jgi:uncharacterized protein YjbJ (UPF0337 family)
VTGNDLKAAVAGLGAFVARPSGMSFAATFATVRVPNVREPEASGNVACSQGQEEEMDWNRVEGNWKQAKGRVKEQWGKLTDDDLDTINGQRDQLEGKLQERYGYAKDQARKEIDDWMNAKQQ